MGTLAAQHNGSGVEPSTPAAQRLPAGNPSPPSASPQPPIAGDETETDPPRPEPPHTPPSPQLPSRSPQRRPSTTAPPSAPSSGGGATTTDPPPPPRIAWPGGRISTSDKGAALHALLKRKAAAGVELTSDQIRAAARLRPTVSTAVAARRCRSSRLAAHARGLAQAPRGRRRSTSTRAPTAMGAEWQPPPVRTRTRFRLGSRAVAPLQHPSADSSGASAAAHRRTARPFHDSAAHPSHDPAIGHRTRGQSSAPVAASNARQPSRRRPHSTPHAPRGSHI